MSDCDYRRRPEEKNDRCINGDTHVYLRVASATLRLSSCAMMDVYHVRQRFPAAASFVTVPLLVLLLFLSTHEIPRGRTTK